MPFNCVAHMREALGMAIEVDQVNLHCAPAGSFHPGSFNVKRSLL